jgi:hypothetical protein
MESYKILCRFNLSDVRGFGHEPIRPLGWAPIRQCALVSTETYSEIPDEQMKWIKKERNIYSQTSWLEKPEVLQHTITIKNSCFRLCCCSLHNVKRIQVKSVKLLITNNAFCIVQRAAAQSKTGIFRDYGVAEAPPGFQADWSDCMHFFFLFLFILFAHLEIMQPRHWSPWDDQTTSILR